MLYFKTYKRYVVDNKITDEVQFNYSHGLVDKNIGLDELNALRLVNAWNTIDHERLRVIYYLGDPS